jgi:hypothetical protein
VVRYTLKGECNVTAFGGYLLDVLYCIALSQAHSPFGQTGRLTFGLPIPKVSRQTSTIGYPSW